MRQKVKVLISVIRGMNPVSRAYIRWGSPIVFTSLVLAVFCRAAAGKIGVYDNMLCLSGELFELFKNMLAAVYVPALIIELLKLAYDSDRIN